MLPATQLAVKLDSHGFALETDSRRERGVAHSRAVMIRFLYYRDPLFMTCSGLYAVNRWIVKPHTHDAFLRGHFNDLLLIPCALPLILQLQRWLGLRLHDAPPAIREIAFHLFIWSVLFECIGPLIMKTTGDPLDVLCYAVGAVVAGLWWRRNYPVRQTQ
jgi:hypothetical protein